MCQEEVLKTLSAKLSISFNGKPPIELGQELTPMEVKDAPHVSWTASPGRFYTLVMYDPDAPSRLEPNLADVKHWLVVNIEGCNVETGEVIAEYVGAGPPQGSGLHRYIFLVFEQNGLTEFREPKSGKASKEHRIKWSMKDFKNEYHFGKAFAGGYFQSQWDPSVDEMKKLMAK